MIHWGTEIPSHRPSLPFIDADGVLDAPTIRPKNSNDRLFFAENDGIVHSLSQLAIDSERNASENGMTPSRSALDYKLTVPSLDSTDHSQASSASSLNMIGSPWLNKIDRFHHPVDKVKFRQDSQNTFRQLLRRQVSKSCDDFAVAAKRVLKRRDSARDEPKVSVEVEAPSDVIKGQDFAVYATVTNKSTNAPITCSVVLRIDAGRKKLRSVSKRMTLEVGEASEVSLMLSGEAIWSLLQRKERHFTVVSTAHVHADGKIHVKMQHIKIRGSKSGLLAASTGSLI